jgi:hypothetical protein
VSSGEQNAEFREPETGTGLKATGTRAFKKAREEPLKYATWLALNAVTDGVTSLQGRVLPRATCPHGTADAPGARLRRPPGSRARRIATTVR